ncbi:queuosine precursor transporter [Aeromicrobium fastidiosum]|uniref:Probable queuosine precursor transporter n=1 Tax=Aeromicrobium fastidiosum TaxID=52699 RepID=A0A641AN51_9ACTN|nr:queuosine precursor transporter [Aeromicrobium fastidiosum]KAA1376079.1 queuosine precursor transporter [Aeromicrobium fastidiosum]MBP2392047.1 putative integral membrane protein (TIGR00697 family) [Aeromicrobium fastidiosum]
MSSQATSPHPEAEVHYASRGSSFFDVLLAVFCVVLVVSNIAATKSTEFLSGHDVSIGPVQVLPIISDGGAILFPLAYILGDVISEVYGFRAARRAILVGFGTAVLAFATFLIAMQLPGASFYENQDAFESVVWSGVQIVGASMLAYLTGQLLNSYVLVKMKARSAEPGLWRRLAGSTGVGEAADTFIFCAVAASAIGITTGGQFVNYFVVGFVFKCAVELLVMPVTMVVIRVLKQREPTYWA